jgi:hypothetical protein
MVHRYEVERDTQPTSLHRHSATWFTSTKLREKRQFTPPQSDMVHQYEVEREETVYTATERHGSPVRSLERRDSLHRHRATWFTGTKFREPTSSTPDKRHICPTPSKSPTAHSAQVSQRQFSHTRCIPAPHPFLVDGCPWQVFVAKPLKGRARLAEGRGSGAAGDGSHIQVVPKLGRQWATAKLDGPSFPELGWLVRSTR